MTDRDLVEKFRNHSYRSGWIAQELLHAKEAMTEALSVVPKRYSHIRRGLVRQVETITRTLDVIAEADKPHLNANTSNWIHTRELPRRRLRNSE